VRLGVIADSHVAVDERAYELAAWHNPFRLVDAHERLAAAVSHPLVRDADVVVVLGDLAHYGDRASIATVVEIMAGCRQPVVLLSGNHDVIEPGIRLEQEVVRVGASNVWSPRAGEPPAALGDAFSGLGLRVIEVTEMWPTERKPFAVEARTVVPGDPGGPGVTLTHFPVLGFQRRCEEAGFLYSGHLKQLATPPADKPDWATHLVLNGHLHVRAVERRGATLQLSFAALVEAPYEIAAVEVTPTDGGIDVAYECTSVRDVTEDKVPVLDSPAGNWQLRTEDPASSAAS
jgi:hypothetical protein